MLPLLIVAGGLLSYTSVKLYHSFSDKKKLSLNKSDLVTATRQLKKPQGRPLLAYQQHQRKKKQQSDRSYWVASGSVGLVMAGTWIAPVFIVPAALGFAYLSLPVWREAKSAIQHKQLNSSVMYAIALPSIVFSGYYLLAALNYWLYHWGQRHLLIAEQQAIKNSSQELMLLPETTWLLRDGVCLEVAVDGLQVNDVICLQVGDMLPIDGTVIKGKAMVNTTFTSDDEQPLLRAVGQRVLASDVLLAGEIQVQVEDIGHQTIVASLHQHSHLNFGQVVQLQGDAVANGFAKPTMIMAALALPFVGMAGALAILVTGMGEAIRLILPLTLLKSLNRASDEKLWLKNISAIAALTRVDSVVFNINNLLVKQQPQIKNIHAFSTWTEIEILSTTAALLQQRDDAVAQAVMKKVLAEELTLPNVGLIKPHQQGVSASFEQQTLHLGSLSFIRQQGIYIPKKQRKVLQKYRTVGYPLLILARDRKIVGLVILGYEIRRDAKQLIKYLNQKGMNTYLISKESKLPVKDIAEQLDIRAKHAKIQGQQSANFVKGLQKQGKVVAFVGDDIETQAVANVSIASRAFGKRAIAKADIVIIDNQPQHIESLFKITQNLKNKLKTSISLSTLPSLVIIVGVLLFNLGLAGAFAIYYTGLALGVANAKKIDDDSDNKKENS